MCYFVLLSVSEVLLNDSVSQSSLTSIFSLSRVNTFRRPDLLEIFLEHYKQCENVKQIQVIWSDQDSKAPIAMLEKYPKGKVIFEVHDSNSLNNRFHNLINIPTEVSNSLHTCLQDNLAIDSKY